MNEVKYLGTIVTPNGIRPDLAKVEAILGMPIPTDKTGVRRLLDMIKPFWQSTYQVYQPLLLLSVTFLSPMYSFSGVQSR